MTHKKNNKSNKYGYEQKQTQIQETAHEMELVIDTLHNMLEPLEEYIGKLNHYPDWDKRRQLYRKRIVNSDYALEGFEDIFLTQLFIVKASVVNKPEFFLKEVQKEFHKWISATGIDTNNCPDRLRHFLFEINEVLEGRGENIVNQTRELVKDRELTTDEALGFFSKLQGPMNKNRERGSLLEGKNWDEAENRNMFSGNFEQGEEAFSQISQGFGSKHANFDLFSEQKKRRGIQQVQQQEIRWDLIIDISGSKNDWEFRKVVTAYYFHGAVKSEGNVLIRKGVKLDSGDYNRTTGELVSQLDRVYREDYFNEKEQAEINAIFNISQSSASSSSYHYQQKADDKLTNSPNQNDNSGKGGIFAIIGVVSALLIASGVVIKKRLSRKIKR